MNNKVQALVAFVLGIAVGGGGAYILTRTKYELLMEEVNESAEDFVNVQIEHSKQEVKEWADNYINEKISAVYDTAAVNGWPEEENRPVQPMEQANEAATLIASVFAKKPSLEEAVRAAKIEEDHREILYKSRPEQIVKEWDKVHEPVEVMPLDDHPHDDESDEDEEEEEQPILPPMKRADTTSIQVISSDEYFEEENTFDKITIVYYEADKTLADEKDGIIPNIVGCLGPDALNSFGKGSNDPNVVYVRNNKTSIDWEVVRNPGSYAEIVLGGSYDQEKPRLRPRKVTPKLKPEEPVAKGKRVKSDGKV